MCGIFVHIGSINIPLDDLLKYINKLKPRGPDRTSINLYPTKNNEQIIMAFHELSIMDNATTKMYQPFEYYGYAGVCNGELYNFEFLFENNLKNYKRQTENDCAIALPLFDKYHYKIVHMLRGEYALVVKLPDGRIFAARDHRGIRPLFIAHNKTSVILASEQKAIPDGYNVIQFPPGHYWYSDKMHSFVSFINFNPVYLSREYQLALKNKRQNMNQFTEIARDLRYVLIQAVEERMNIGSSKIDIGVLLSGGMDSSSIAAIMNMLNKHKYDNRFKIRAFTIGYEDCSTSSDVKYAKIVADTLGLSLDVVKYTKLEGIEAIPKVIEAFETYDVTTIRAGVPMYLLAKYIRSETNIKVVLSGEGSDELLGGYLYTEFAPNLDELYKDNVRLLNNIHFYDVLRADRAISSNGLELRVPFLDKRVVDYIQTIHPFFLSQHTSIVHDKHYVEFKDGTGLNKMILRMAMASMLPNAILFRKKEAFSDGVSHSWRQSIIDHVSKLNVSEREYYLQFYNKFFINRRHMIPDYWMPKWIPTQTLDPSATVLTNYSK